MLLTAALYGDPRVNTGRTNAFRHVVWATMLTLAFGRSFAAQFMGIHEKRPTNKKERDDNEADAANNALGIKFGMAMQRQGHSYLDPDAWSTVAVTVSWLADNRGLAGT